jgi:hypothetical protein
MTTDDVREMIENESDMNDSELREAFRAVYGRDPDAKDEADGVYSLICAGLEADEK